MKKKTKILSFKDKLKYKKIIDKEKKIQEGFDSIFDNFLKENNIDLESLKKEESKEV